MRFRIGTFNLHQGHVRQEDALREFMVGQLLDWIGRREASDARLICGDFNATPGMRSVQLMGNRFSATQMAPTFATPLRYRVDPDTQDTGSTSGLSRRVSNYISYEMPLRLIETGLCFDTPAGDDPDLWRSDHVGVWADFDLG